MISRIEVLVRRLRRRFSRSEWLAQLLQLPVSAGTETAPGLVMIQIDGLSHREFERAIERGEVPFMRRLIDREHYRLQRHYSGVPSMTAAFQGELFYGVKTAVPAFGFMERTSGRLVRMFEPAIAGRVEHRLEAAGNEPLLARGSCYADNFAGGAAEAHFCPASQGWGPALREAHPLAVALLIFSNGYSCLRMMALLFVEVALAIVDCVRGMIGGQDVFEEIKLVPFRVAIAIVLRELATIGAKIDVARGVEIVHVNFLGYDEQAHRRGPSSRFAHWTLKGIDDAIARIWRGAYQSARRHYDVWVYSDHGQESARSYDKIHGHGLTEALAEVLAKHEGKPIDYRSSGHQGVQLQRVRLLGGGWLPSLLRMNNHPQEEPAPPQLTVAPLGPLAMIYYDRVLAPGERNSLARAMVEDAKVPMVLLKEAAGAHAFTTEGEFVLPQECARVLGADHPFLDQATQDLIALCHHDNAGDFIACGWRTGLPAVTFAVENGAHGGPAPHETGIFTLLPADVDLPLSGGTYARPTDLRQAARRFLHRCAMDTATTPRSKATRPDALRIMSYNVHSCVGMDGKLAPERVARVIARYAPDIVALQELDVGRLRTRAVDQAHVIARHLEMAFHFHPAIHLEEERYGNAILTRLPMRLVKAGLLRGVPRNSSIEPRGAVWVAIDVGGDEIQVLNTHLGLLPSERNLQAEALLGPEWLSHPQCDALTVLCGDFNALPSSAACRRLRGRLKDAQVELQSHRPKGTFPGRLRAARIDHVFVDRRFDVVNIEVPSTELTRVASDHLPLIVEVRIPKLAETARAHDTDATPTALRS